MIRYADIIAYLSHDLDDAIRSGVIGVDDVPKQCNEVLGNTHSGRILAMVQGVLDGTGPAGDRLAFGIAPDIGEAMQELRQFLFHRVYRSPRVHEEFIKATKMLRELFIYCVEHKDFLEKEIGSFATSISLERRVCDYLASMTDRYAQHMYQRLFLSNPLV